MQKDQEVTAQSWERVYRAKKATKPLDTLLPNSLCLKLRGEANGKVSLSNGCQKEVVLSEVIWEKQDSESHRGEERNQREDAMPED